MAKKDENKVTTTSKEGSETSPSLEVVVITGEDSETSPPIEKASFMFRGNRAFELHIGRRMYRFEGRKIRTLPKSILKHPDWTKQIKNLFTVKEI